MAYRNVEGAKLMIEERYTISIIDDRARYIECNVLVNVSIQVAIDFTRDIDALIEQESLPFLLIDLRGVRNIATGGHNYEYTHNTLNDKTHRSNTVALLVDENDYSHDFIETISLNTGHKTQLFRDESSARQWLLENIKAQSNSSSSLF